jgi:hypothetical protein
MRKSNWTPSIVPDENDRTIYLVADDLGSPAAPGAKPITKPPTSKRSFKIFWPGNRKPSRGVAFNTAERWSEDVSVDIAHELRRRCDLQMRDIPFYLQDFTDRYEGRYHDIQLPLPMRLV